MVVHLDRPARPLEALNTDRFDVHVQIEMMHGRRAGGTPTQAFHRIDHPTHDFRHGLACISHQNTHLEEHEGHEEINWLKQIEAPIIDIK
jgi:hypothetical protein